MIGWRGLAVLAVAGLEAWLASSAALAQPRTALARPQHDSVTRVAVFGADERTSVPARYAESKAKIGLLVNEQAKTVCTAFCVAKDLVATAAHCLYRTNADRRPRLSDFTFLPDRKQSSRVARIAGASTSVVNHNVVAGTTRIRTRPPIDAASDWALARLDRPICTGGGLRVEAVSMEALAEASRDGRVFQLSYHRDYANWRMAYSKPCEARPTFGTITRATLTRDFANPGSLILHRCATGGASSGSPLLMDTSNGPVVVGINVGTYVLSRIQRETSGNDPQVLQEVIANTAVSAHAFSSLVARFRSVPLLQSEDDVRELQLHLQALRHYMGPIDGSYGPLLKAAIEEFERANGLPVTGFATNDLLGLLASDAEFFNRSAIRTIGRSRPALHTGATGQTRQ